MPTSRRGSMWMSRGALVEGVLPQPVDDVDDVLVVGVELPVACPARPAARSCARATMSPRDVSCAFFIERARLKNSPM